MKKILITIMSIIGIASINLIKVDAAEYKYHGYIYEGDKIDNIYYKNRDDSLREAHFYKNNESDKIIYSIEYGGETQGAGYNDYDDTFDYRLTNLTQEQTKKMNLIGYYGYSYKDEKYDHTDKKWYAITQYLIWKVEENNLLSGMVDAKGNDIFGEEIKEMEKILEEHFIKPNFGSNSYKLKAYDEITIEDENHVLDYYEAKEHFGLEYYVEDNKIIATSSKNDSYTLYLTKKDKRYSTSSIFYVSDDYQNAMSIGKFDDVTSLVKFNFVSGKVFINKNGDQLVDYQDEKFIYKSLQAVGTVYHLYAKNDIINNVGKLLYKKDELVSELVIGEKSSFDNLYLSDYYAKEISNPYAYHITGNPYNISLNLSKTSQSVTFKSNYQQVKVRFAAMKQISSFTDGKVKYELVPHASLKFGLYSADDIYSDIDSTTPIVAKDTLLAISESDASGSVNFNTNIPLGNYYIIGLSEDNDYYLKEEKQEFSFNLDSSVSIQYINLKNYYNMLKTQKIIFEGEGKLNIYDEDMKLVISEDVSGDFVISLPLGKYYYDSNDGEKHFLNVNSMEEIFITLDQKNESNGLIKPPVITIPGGNNVTSNENVNENITQNIYKPTVDPDKEENNSKEESKEEDKKEEIEMPIPDVEERPSEPEEDIKTPEETDEGKKEEEEIPTPDVEERPSETEEDIKNPEEIEEDKKEEIETPTPDVEEKPSEIEEDTKTPEETDEDKKEEVEVPTPDVEEKPSEIEEDTKTPEETDEGEKEEEETPTIDVEEKPSETEEDLKTPEEIEEDTRDNNEYDSSIDDNIEDMPNKDEELKNDNTQNQEVIKSEDVNGENKPSNEFLSSIDSSNENYEEISVVVPSTDKNDMSLIFYIAIIILSSLTYIYVKE